MLSQITLKTPAKINIGLWVERKREDGYHNIKTIFVPITLYDELKLITAENIECVCDDPCIPSGEKNLAYKAAQEFFRYTGLKGGVKIHIKKNIPAGRGLGGGSSDAAAVINGLCNMFDINLSFEERVFLALKIGMDVVFFLRPFPAIAEDRGEKLSYFKSLNFPILLYCPTFGISTKWAYASLKELTNAGNCIKILKDSLMQGEFEKIEKCEFNVFEDIVFKKYPLLLEVKKEMKKAGAYFSLLSGSGSAVYGIFKNDIGEDVYRKLEEKFEGDWYKCELAI